MICGASAWGDDDPFEIDWYNPAASMGSALHEIAAEMLTNGYEVPEDLSPYADKWGVEDLKELRILAFMVKDFLVNSGYMAGGEHFIEKRLEYMTHCDTFGEDKKAPDDYALSGHPDAYVLIDEHNTGNPNVCIVLDWKSTRLKDVDYRAQMKTYCVLVGARNPHIEKYITCTVYVRDREVDIREYSIAQIDQFEYEFENRVALWNTRKPKYVAGPHCRFCPRALFCDAQVLEARRAVQIFLDMEEMPEDATDDLLVQAYQNGQLATKRYNNEFRTFVKARMVASGADIVGDEAKITLRQDRPKENIVYKKAQKVLEAWLTPDELYEGGIISVGKTKLMDAIGAKFEKGKGKMKEAAMEELRAKEGAVETVETEPKLWLMKRKGDE